MLEALASLSVAPHPRLSEQEVRERRLARAAAPMDRARGLVRGGGLAAARARRAPARRDRLDPARRPPAARAPRPARQPLLRVPRARARCSPSAPDERACHAIHAAAFGLYGARHLAVPELDADLVSPGESWWDAPFAPVQGYLRRPGSGETARGPRRAGRRRRAGAAAGARGGTAPPRARRRAAGPAAGRPDAALLAPRARRAVLRPAAGRDRAGADRRHGRLLRRRHAPADRLRHGRGPPDRGDPRRRRRRAREPGPAGPGRPGGRDRTRIGCATPGARCWRGPLLLAERPRVRHGARARRAPARGVPARAGYELVVRASHARLRKRSDELRSRPSGPDPARRPPRHLAAVHAPPLRPVRARARRRASARGCRRASGCWPRRCARWPPRRASSSTSTASTTAAAWRTSCTS